MAEDEYIGLGARYLALHGGFQVKGVSQNMSHEDADTIEFNRSLGLKAGRQDPFIYIPANRGHGRQRLKLLINLNVSNVAGMENVIDSGKQGRDIGIKQSMRV
jgi:hypothetical protein